jgi:lipoate-protein ligase A
MYIDMLVLDRLDGSAGHAVAAYPVRKTEVVLGRSTSLEEVHADRCRADRVPVLRRAGGGGVVVLSPGMVVISVAGTSGIPFCLREHMNLVNRRVMAALEGLGVGDLSLRGISDIALGDRKLLGSYLYRRRDLVLYQGSLLVNPDLGLIDRYLKHPRTEPDYRRGRPHADFLTSLRRQGYTLTPGQVAAEILEVLGRSNPWRREAARELR